MKRILILLALILLFISCQKREWGNPFDPNCPKEIWTPTDFTAIQEGTNVKISWNQPVNPISGFKIQKVIDGGSNTSLPDQLKGINQLVDNGLTGGKVHVYSLFAYAGDNVSNTVTVQITPRLTAEVTTSNVSMITSNSVETGCFVTSDGGAPIIARGVCWSTKQNPTVADSKDSGTGTGIFRSTIIGLTPGMTYYIRAFATNSIGTSYGNQIITTTTAILPTITTTAASAVTATTATSGGNITSDGGAVVIARGICWSTVQNPTTTNSKTIDGTSTGIFTSLTTGLNPTTTYYFRAYATNSVGTVYGSSISFTTQAVSTVTDIDGNVYTAVTIGTQVWMGENLKTTKYRNGDPIPNPNVTDNTVWAALTTGAYCWYNNDVANKVIYGALYNWYAVNDIRNIAPNGWHVPTNAEWTILITYLGGQNIAGGKLKETGTTHWVSPNTGATNERGFTAIPGGTRTGGTLISIGRESYWWSSTVYDIVNAWGCSVYYNDSGIYNGSSGKSIGFSVRCLKD